MSGILAWHHPWSRALCPSRPLGSATLFVDPIDGNAVTQVDLFPIPTRVGQRVKLTHNADSARTGQMSQGWILSFNERLFDNDPTDIVYMDATGAEWTFTGAGPSYTRPNGLLATLRETSGGGWTLYFWLTGEVRTFNANGYLTEIRDRNGNTLTINRNGSDEITSVTTDDSGEVETLLDIFVYASGRLVKIGRSDCGGWLWLFGYDGSNRLNKITDPEADTLDFTFDSTSSRLASISDWRGNATAIAYTSTKVTTITDPATKTNTVAYPVGGQTTITDRRANVTTYSHSGGAVDDITPPVAAMKVTWTRNADFQTLTHTLAGATQTWTYGALGRVASFTDALGNTWGYSDDATVPEVGPTETTATDPDGNVTTSKLDGQGNVISVLTPMGFLTKHTYSGNGDLVLTTPPKGPATGAAHDPLTGMPTASFVVAAPEGGAADASLCEQNASATSYDTLLPWLPARTTDADGVARTLRYNKVGMVVETASYADGVKMATTLTHDANGNVLTSTGPEGGVTTSVFNANNWPTSVTDAVGNATTYTYDNEGNITRRTDPGTNNWDQTFDAANRLITQTDPGGGTTTYTLDGAGNVTNRRDPRLSDWATEFDLNNRVTKQKAPLEGALTADTTYTYTDTGLLSTVTDPEANLTTNIYDNDSRLIEVRKPLGSVSRTHYNPAGQVVGQIDPTGAATTYGYDALGRQVSVTDPRGNTTRRTYTMAGRVKTVTTADGATTTNDYDRAGRLVKVTNPQGAATSYEFNANGQTTAVSTPDGGRTETVYNKVGQPTLVRVKSSRDGRPYWLETATTYNSRGLVDEVTNPAGRVNKNTYDANGRLIKITKDVGGIGATVDYTLDANGNHTKIVQSINATTGTEHSMTYNKANWKTEDKHLVSTGPSVYETTTYTLNDNAQPTTITFPDTNTYVYVYDALGRRTKWTDRLSRVTAYEYDLAGRQTLMVTPDLKETLTSYDSAGNVVERIFRGNPTDTSKDVVETFEYNSLNKLALRTDADERETTMGYNLLGQLETVTDATGDTRTNVYSKGGQLTAQLAPGGARIHYEYTLDGRIARVTGFSGFVKEYEWCCCGMESYTDEKGTTLMEHNALAQLTSITYASGLTVTLVPNHLGWTDTITLPKTSGTEDTDYTYDLRGRVLSVTVPDASPTTITVARDTMGRPTTVTYSGSHNVVYAWDAMGRVTSITSTGKNAANTYVLTYAYVTNADRVSSITTTAAGVTVATQTLTYNARNQITKEKVQDGVPATTWERDYTYTAAGLRTKIDDIQEQWDSTFQHDQAGRLVLVQTTDNSGGAKTNPFPWWEGSTKVSTSPNGDVVSMVSGANRIAYRYDEEHRLVEAQMASGDPVSVTYDGLGNLVSIVQGATTQKTLTYQGRILQTRDSSDVLQDRNFWMGSNLMRVNIDASARNQVWDARGSNDLSYQTDGTMDKTRMWDNWGLEVFAAGAGSAPDVGFLSNFDLGASGLSITPRNNAWWAELGKSVEGGWHPRFELSPFGCGSGPCTAPAVSGDAPNPNDPNCIGSCGIADGNACDCTPECRRGEIWIVCPESQTKASAECLACLTETAGCGDEYWAPLEGTECERGPRVSNWICGLILGSAVRNACLGIVASIALWGANQQCRKVKVRACCRQDPPPKGCIPNDKWVHCVMACRLSREGLACGGTTFARCVLQFWEDHQPGDYDWRDIIANNVGVNCASTWAWCGTCCSKTYPKHP